MLPETETPINPLARHSLMHLIRVDIRPFPLLAQLTGSYC